MLAHWGPRAVHRRVPGASYLRIVIVWGICRSLVRVFFGIFHGFRATGHENIPQTGPLIYVANHQSHFDPPAVGAAIHPRPCAFLARASLFKFRPFGAMIRFMFAIPLGRGGGASGLRSALTELEAGRCVLIFPEGTRSEGDTMGKFRHGFYLLAQRTGASIVPVRLEGAGRAWPRTRSLPRLFSRRMTAEIRPSIPSETITALKAEEAADLLRKHLSPTTPATTD